ncbi:MAG: hypothetical protein PHT16_00365 [Candidatus Pacebacteria bacterium]|nr:hypothetical protein [Candidatus Paceibacterota bacterium]
MIKSHLIRYQKIAIAILIIILFGLLIFYFISRPKSPPSLTDEQRLEILQKPSNIPPANPNMTDEERLKILSQPSEASPITKIKNIKFNEN